MAKNLTGLPSLPANRPQASLGNAASPCSTISSKKARSSSIIAGATTVPARWYSLNGCSGAGGEPAGDGDRPGPAPHRDPDVGPADASTGELLGHPLGVERGDQEPARGLRVREHQLLGDRKLPPLHVRAQVRVVALGAAGDHIEHRE